MTVPDEVRAAVEARDRGCVLGRVELEDGNRSRCGGRLDPHHRWRKGQGGPDSLDNLILLCRTHHVYVHGHTGWSLARGYLLRSPMGSTETPVPDYTRGDERAAGW